MKSVNLVRYFQNYVTSEAVGVYSFIYLLSREKLHDIQTLYDVNDISHYPF